MGIFTKNKPSVVAGLKSELTWVKIRSIAQLEEIIQTTVEKPVLFFKHSNRCITSTIALKTFNQEWTRCSEPCDLYFVDVLEQRDVSNEIARLTGIRHESPQVIVLKGRDIIYDASHSAIDVRRIQSALRRS